MAGAIIGGLSRAAATGASDRRRRPGRRAAREAAHDFGVRALPAADATLASGGAGRLGRQAAVLPGRGAAVRAARRQRAAAERDGRHPQRRDRARGAHAARRARDAEHAGADRPGHLRACTRATRSARPSARSVEQVLAPTGQPLWVEREAGPRRRHRAVGLGPGLCLLFRRGDDAGGRRDGPERRAGQAARARHLRRRDGAGRGVRRAARACCASASRPRAARPTPRSPRSRPTACKAAFVKALKAAQQRARELGDEFGRA